MKMKVNRVLEGLIVILFALWAGIILGSGRSARAQTVVPPLVFQSTIPHTGCPTAPAAAGQLCIASDGLFYNKAGGTLVEVDMPPSAAGVTSLSVNGGAPQTGPVAITIPTKATVVVPSQTVTAPVQ